MLRLGDVAFLSGTLGFLSVASLLLVPQMFSKPEESKPKFSNLDVTCWTPDVFTSTWVSYAQKYCKASLLNNRSYHISQGDIPMSNGGVDVFSIYDELVEDENNEDEMSVFDVSSKRSVLMLVVFEVLFIFGFYSLFLIGHQGDSALCRIVSVGGHVIGVLFFLLAAFIPYLSLSNATALLVKAPQEKSGVFLCDFAVRRLGNVARYTVQCAYSLSVPAPQAVSEGNVEPFLSLNGIVCGAVVIAIIGSLISSLTAKKESYSKDQAV